MIFYLFVKRLFDIICGLIGIILLIPLTIIIKIAYICHGDFHSVFYTQKRIGKNGKEFTIIKYRSMVPGADKDLSKLLEDNAALKEEYKENKKLRKDPRITKVGRFLRATSLDEMPQFINVFCGKMSVIGNRPYLPGEKEDMGKYFDDIVSLKPGISGYWQVSGHNETNFKQRLKLEQEYAKKASLGLDARIFFDTFKVLAGKKGV